MHHQRALLVGALVVLAFIILTALDGSPIFVEANQIAIIRTHSKECGPNAHAVIRVSGMALCVKETPEQIREKIDRGD